MFWWILSAGLRLESVVLAIALALAIFTVREFRGVPVEMPAESARVRADMRSDATARAGVLEDDLDYHRNGEPSRAVGRGLPALLPGSFSNRESSDDDRYGLY